MAHFAQLDDDNKVTQIIMINDAELLDETGQESESRGIAFCQTLFPGTRWVRTSYDAAFRKNYAGTDFTYDADRDAFIAPQPFAGWILDESTCRWKAPVPCPDDGKRYAWNKDTLSWAENPES